jgi:stage III sporulation protein AA
MENWCHIFPEYLQEPLQQGHQLLEEKTEEIRLRVGQPMVIQGNGRKLWWDCVQWSEIKPVGDQKDADHKDKDEKWLLQPQVIQHVFNRISQGSLYALEEELKNGYITIPGGHRLGFCGRAVLENGQLRTIKDIRFMNLRIARQIQHGVAELLPWLKFNGRWLSLLIISPPMGGKTTLLRELVRLASQDVNVSLVDERSELAGSYLGQPQFDVGPSTDVLDGCPKAQGMMLMIRSMAPQVLAVDEIGHSQDLEALHHALACGIVVFATIHGLDQRELQKRPGLQALIAQGLFQRILVLKGYGSKRLKPDIYEGKTLHKLY